MKKNMTLLLTIFVISFPLLAKDVFISKITHTFSDSLRHLIVQTDHLGDLSSLTVLEYENGNMVSETLIPVEDLVNNEIDIPLAINKLIRIEAVNFSKEFGGKLFINYSPNIFSSDRYEINFELAKNQDSWMLIDQKEKIVKHLRLVVNKKAMMPVGIKEFIINP